MILGLGLIMFCSSSHFKVLPNFASKMVLHDTIETSPFQDNKPNHNRPYNSQREVKLLQIVKDTLQNPEPSFVRYGNLYWLPHRTIGKESYIDSQIVAIPWNRLEDFVQGEQQNPEFPCKFNRQVQWRNDPRMLAFSQACSPNQIIL